MKKFKFKKLDKDDYNFRTIREFLLAMIDCCIIAFGFIISVWLSQQYLFTNVDSIMKNAMLALLAVVPIYFISLWICRVYKVVWRYARIRDYLKILVASIIAIVTFIVLDQAVLHLVAMRIPLFEGEPINVKAYPVYTQMSVMILTLLVLSRVFYQFIYFRIKVKSKFNKRKTTMIVGAGYTASNILEELTRGNSPYNPVCIVDDDFDKLGRKVCGVRIVGSTSEIPRFAKKYLIETIIFAIPSLDDESRRNILHNCFETGCEVKVLPYVSEMISNVGIVNQIHDIKIEDLLGRSQITFDDEGITGYVKGKVVMITGGGGSIGSELVRQIANYRPSNIVIVEIYENCAYAIQQEMLRTHGANYNINIEIASITDYDKMDELFREYRPDIIFHAAAHKHVPLMETNPEEAVKNNVFGTYNIARLAGLYKVKKFIMVSTDKAVNPTNVMGATKRCCEKVVQWMANQGYITEYAAVRFGNVLGSNGSVIPLFKKQIESGGPVTVTHQHITRFFMTIPEAVRLILQAGAFAKGGEIFVLDMGKPVKILDLAENMIKMMGYEPYKQIKIEFTGLRPGEKLYEELLMSDEGLKKTANEKIYVGKQGSLDYDKFIEELQKMYSICYTNDKRAVVEQLQVLVPGFKHDEKYLSLMEDKLKYSIAYNALTPTKALIGNAKNASGKEHSSITVAPQPTIEETIDVDYKVMTVKELAEVTGRSKQVIYKLKKGLGRLPTVDEVLNRKSGRPAYMENIVNDKIYKEGN